MKTRILIVDDHEVVREGLKIMLAKFRPDWEICGEASNGRAAVWAAADLKPDIVLLDVTMPTMSGLEACSEIRRCGVMCPVLFFTMHDSGPFAAEAEHVGAQGYVVKAQAAQHLVTAIETLLAGGTFFGGLAKPKRKKDAEPNPGLSFCESLAFGAA